MSLTGTIHAVDKRARTLHVATGVGYALWTVPFHGPKGCLINVKEEPAKLEKLWPGNVVRVEYQKEGNRFSVRVIRTVQSGGVRQ